MLGGGRLWRTCADPVLPGTPLDSSPYEQAVEWRVCIIQVIAVDIMLFLA